MKVWLRSAQVTLHVTLENEGSYDVEEGRITRHFSGHYTLAELEQIRRDMLAVQDAYDDSCSPDKVPEHYLVDGGNAYYLERGTLMWAAMPDHGRQLPPARNSDEWGEVDFFSSEPEAKVYCERVRDALRAMPEMRKVTED